MQSVKAPHAPATLVPAMPWFDLLCSLTKIRISVAVTLTTATGYIMKSGRLDWGLVAALLGTVLLAMGASALNQCQEVSIDAAMIRTRNRPIPSGRLSRSTALFISGLLILLGLYVLALSPIRPGVVVGIGLLSVFWYNGVYTYLKRVSAFAVVPGAFIGALPPVIGWCAAGGALGDPLILLTAVFFFIWQIPHFWLLLILHGDEYAAAGLPTLTQLFSRGQLARVTCMWILGTATTGLFFPALAHESLALPWNAAVVVASFWLGSKGLALLWPARDVAPEKVFRRGFMQINLYALFVMLSLSLCALGLGW